MTKTRWPWLLASFLTVAVNPPAPANDEPVLRQEFQPGDRHRVSVRVRITGELQVPIKQDESPRTVKLTGSSEIDYDERLLSPNPMDGASRSFRIYRNIKFHRVVDGEEQSSTLRPEVRRLVLLRRDRVKVPFSPDGPLTWGEIDLIRTDTFLSALSGLLPGKAVRPGDDWDASPDAVSELTDLEKIESGGLTCSLVDISPFGGRPLARVLIKGTVSGVNEDGPSRQKLEGFLYFDIADSRISYISLNGLHELLDEDGKVAGKVEGRFTLTSKAGTQSAGLDDDDLRGLKLEPDPERTHLLYDDPTLGVRLLYPRHWQLGEERDRQVALDSAEGSGLLLTVDNLDGVPTVDAFRKEAEGLLKKYGAERLRFGRPERVAVGVERFRAEGTLNDKPVLMDYYIVRQARIGATIAARLNPADRNAASEVERIVRSLQLGQNRGE